MSEANVKTNRVVSTNWTNHKERTVCSYHVTYAFQSESTLYSCLNVKELFARTKNKERSNYFIFLKIWFQFKNLLIKSCFDVPVTQMSIFILLVSAGILFEDDFSL